MKNPNYKQKLLKIYTTEEFIMDSLHIAIFIIAWILVGR